MAQRADIGALGARHVEQPVAVDAADQLQTVDRDRTGGALHFPAAAGNVVQALAVHLDGGVHGRHLQNLTPEGAERGFKLGARHMLLSLREHTSGDILRIRHNAEAQAGDITLFTRLGKGHRLGRAAEKDDEQPRRHRVERSGMPDALFAEHAAELCHHVVACPVGGLVYKQYAVHAGHSASMAFSRRSTAVSGSQSSVQPAAIL